MKKEDIVSITDLSPSSFQGTGVRRIMHVDERNLPLSASFNLQPYIEGGVVPNNPRPPPPPPPERPQIRWEREDDDSYYNRKSKKARTECSCTECGAKLYKFLLIFKTKRCVNPYCGNYYNYYKLQRNEFWY